MTTKRICVMGSAPSSVQLAPFTDPNWEIWACSPGAVPHLKRVNRFFELHRWEPGKPWFMPDYVTWLHHLKDHNIPVYMIEPIPVVPTSVAYPKDKMLVEFGPHFFTSSVAWMMAMAITEGATEIMLCGVDMSADDEVYSQQRAGCHYFIHEARRRGIVVTVPPESDLLLPTRLYGFCEVDPQHIKMLSRKEELTTRLNAKKLELQAANNEMFFLEGALSDVNYQLTTWVTDPLAKQLAYLNPEPKVEPAPVAGGTAVLTYNNETGILKDGAGNVIASPKLDAYMPALPTKKGIAKKNGTNGKHPPEGP